MSMHLVYIRYQIYLCRQKIPRLRNIIGKLKATEDSERFIRVISILTKALNATIKDLKYFQDQYCMLLG